MDKDKNSLHHQELLFKVAQELLNSESVQQTADIIVNTLYSTINSFDCAFFRFEPTHNQLICTSYASRESKGLESFKLKPIALGAGVVGHCAVEKATKNIANRADCDYWLDYVETNISELTVPVLVEGELVGVIDLEDDRDSYFDSDIQSCVETVAMMTAKFLQQQMLLVKQLCDPDANHIPSE